MHAGQFGRYGQRPTRLAHRVALCQPKKDLKLAYGQLCMAWHFIRGDAWRQPATGNPIRTGANAFSKGLDQPSWRLRLAHERRHAKPAEGVRIALARQSAVDNNRQLAPVCRQVPEDVNRAATWNVNIQNEGVDTAVGQTNHCLWSISGFPPQRKTLFLIKQLSQPGPRHGMVVHDTYPDATAMRSRPIPFCGEADTALNA